VPGRRLVREGTEQPVARATNAGPFRIASKMGEYLPDLCRSGSCGCCGKSYGKCGSSRRKVRGQYVNPFTPVHVVCEKGHNCYPWPTARHLPGISYCAPGCCMRVNRSMWNKRARADTPGVRPGLAASRSLQRGSAPGRHPRRRASTAAPAGVPQDPPRARGRLRRTVPASR
jgi:hypothetical protein